MYGGFPLRGYADVIVLPWRQRERFKIDMPQLKAVRHARKRDIPVELTIDGDRIVGVLFVASQYPGFGSSRS